MNTKIQELLHELEKTREIYWNITPEVGKFLSNFIQKNDYKTVLEIGTSNGYSGIWLAEALNHTKGVLYTIESNSKKRFPLSQANFAKSGLSNVIQILGHAPEAIPDMPKTFDMAFFDATKYEHIDYFNTLKDRITPGGTIITDNINSHRKELTPYIENINQEPNWTSSEKSIGTGLLISRKAL